MKESREEGRNSDRTQSRLRKNRRTCPRMGWMKKMAETDVVISAVMLGRKG